MRNRKKDSRLWKVKQKRSGRPLKITTKSTGSIKICKAYERSHWSWSNEAEDRCKDVTPNGRDRTKMLTDNSYGKQMKETQSRHNWYSWREEHIHGMKNIYVNKAVAKWATQ